MTTFQTPYPYKITVTDKDDDAVTNTSISLSSATTNQKVTSTTNGSGRAVLDAGSFTSHTTGDVLYLEVGTATKYEGIRLAKKIAREIKYIIKNNWRTSSYMGELVNPVMSASHPLPIDEDLGVIRYTMEWRFSGPNIGETEQ